MCDLNFASEYYTRIFTAEIRLWCDEQKMADDLSEELNASDNDDNDISKCSCQQPHSLYNRLHRLGSLKFTVVHR